MRIFVNSVPATIKTFTLDVEANDRVQDIKAKLFDKVSVPPDKQWLIFDGKTLEHRHKLSDYNIKANDPIELVYPVPPGYGEFEEEQPRPKPKRVRIHVGAVPVTVQESDSILQMKTEISTITGIAPEEQHIVVFASESQINTVRRSS